MEKVATVYEADPSHSIEPSSPNWWENVHHVVIVCGRNRGRSIIGEVILKEKTNCIFHRHGHRIRVDSGALSIDPSKNITGLHAQVHQELVNRGHFHEPIDMGYGPVQLTLYKIRGPQPLSLCGIGPNTDVVAFVGESLIRHTLPDHLDHNVFPRSIICIPVWDPSDPPNGMTVQEAIAHCYDQIYHIVHHQLPGILDNVAHGRYIGTPFMHRGIIHPFGYQPPTRRYGVVDIIGPEFGPW